MNDRIRVYYNSREKTLSLQTYIKGWRVSAYSDKFTLTNVRVLKVGNKTILEGSHAGTDVPPRWTLTEALDTDTIYSFVHILVDDSKPLIYTYA